MRRTLARALILCVCCARASVRLGAAQQRPDGSAPPCGRQAAGPAANSVAVLTFENVTRDTSAQYLAEGLADQIFTRLNRLDRLAVVSRTAVRRLRGADQMSVQQIGRALISAYLVNGSIRAAGGRVRVNVEVLRATTGRAVWSDAYDQAADDLAGIEDAVAAEVAAGVGGRLTPLERSRLGGGRRVAAGPAYAAFLRGNVLLARRTATSLLAAIAAYREAVAGDSTQTEAWGRMSYAQALCAGYGCGDRDSMIRQSRRAAERALRMDPRSSDAWLGRAMMLTIGYWPLGGDDSLLQALLAFRRAIALDPRNAEAWHQYGATLRTFDDSASIPPLRRALALDPYRAITYLDLSTSYYFLGRVDRAMATADSALALEPDAAFGMWRALYRLAQGDTAGAVADARRTPTVMLGPAILAVFGHDSAAAVLAESRAAARGCGASAAFLLWTGRREQAVQQILHCGPSLWTRWELRMPVMASLADDPRMQALLAESERALTRLPWRGAPRVP